jgi:beta-lactamase superfamily II metal-dependent hydrolase
MNRAAILIGLLILVANVAFAQQLEIVHINVGQGDSTLITSPSGKTVLIDAGDTGRGNSAVRPYLAARGITHLDYVVSSHYHADHIGGLDEVINGLGASNIGLALDRGGSYSTAAYNQYANAASGHRVAVTPGQVYYLGGGVWMKCVASNGYVLNYGYVSGATGDENNLSVAWVIYYGGFKYYTGGDLAGESGSYKNFETPIAPSVGLVDAMKVGHHGGATSTTQYFLNILQPSAAVIPVGSNSYGHPTQAVLNRLASVGCDIYQIATGSGGTIPVGHGWIANNQVKLSTEGSSDFTMSFGSTSKTYLLHTAVVSPLAMRSLPTSSKIAITRCVVTASYADHFYIEQTNRTNGIRVNSTASPQVNSMVNVLGAPNASPTEEDAINASDVFVFTDEPNCSIQPFGMSNRDINGELYNSVAVKSSRGPSNAALLVKTWGRVSEVPGTGVFYVDDGTGCPVRVAYDGQIHKGDYVSVVGVVGFHVSNGQPERFIKTRGAGDVTTFPG